MLRDPFVPLAALSCALAACLLSCSRYPPPPDAPEINPSAAGKAAVAKYDANGDGKIGADEAKKSPPLTVAFERIDADKDKLLTADEIAARIKGWLKSGVTVTNGSTHVTLGGRDLEGATVTFEPEEFLGPAFKPCSGVTDAHGQTSIRGHNEKYPGIYLGLYRIKVSKGAGGQETIPPRYNADTELGYEAATDLPFVQGLIELRLQAK